MPVKSVPEPKHRHLKAVISDALETEFSVGEVLPTERELAARFGVARATLRQALEQLELEGRLQRRRGVGTTVAPPRVPVEVGPADGEVWEPEGCAREHLPRAVARLLDLPEGATALAVRRGRLSHGQQVATEVLYVPDAVLPGQEADAHGVLRALDTLECEAQDRSVELASARTDDARRLDRLPGAPVLLVTTRYRAAGRVAALSLATYRADTCRLSFGEGLLAA